MCFRIEKDSIGELKIPSDKLWGIHTQRALSNFPFSTLVNSKYFYKALSQVKLSACLTNIELGYISEEIGKPLMIALQEMIDGEHFKHFVVDPVQGGAGTSTNMNINEIAANRTCELLEKEKGSYYVDPLVHVNLHQSTNDVYPTAMKIAFLYYLNDLEEVVNDLVISFQEREKEFENIIKLGRTEYGGAVPYTLGKQFSSFAEAIGRDRWRISRAKERIRQVNIGGTIIGTCIAAPRKYIFRVINNLRKITELPLSRNENLIDGTQNFDQTGEAFSIVKILSLNLEKISRDLKTLFLLKEISLPIVQEGSSIMPGKYNPVILEMVSSVSKKVIGNDLTCSLVISNGELELNPFLPIMAFSIFESMNLMIQAVKLLNNKCIKGIVALKENCRSNLFNNPSSSTIFLHPLGREKVKKLAHYMSVNESDLKTSVLNLKLFSLEEFENLTSPEKIMSMGFV
jgi:aspartate ammonia-lyase